MLATPDRTSACAKSALPARVGKGWPARSSASSVSMRSAKSGASCRPAARRRAGPEVSRISRARRRASRRDRRAGKSSGRPGGWLPLRMTKPPGCAAAAIAVSAAAARALVQAGPGSISRYCPPVLRSVTASDCRVSPGPSKGATGTRSAWSRVSRCCPVGPATATKAVALPPRMRIARATLMPPPPGSRLGASQRSFGPGRTSAAEVARSSEGFSVTVRICGAGGGAGGVAVRGKGMSRRGGGGGRCREACGGLGRRAMAVTPC